MDALTLIPKGMLFKLIKNKFTKKAGFEVTKAEIKINYKTDKFTIVLIGKTGKVEDSDEIKNFSDMSSILLNKVTEKTKADKIDIIDMTVDLVEKKSEADIYFIVGEEFKHIKLKEIF